MKRFAAVYLATARQFLRDRMAILFTVLLPLALAGFFGLIFAGDETVQTGGIPPAQLYVPGMLALAILWLGVFGTAPPLVQLREAQVLRRIRATPLPLSTLLGAQVAFRVTTGLVQAALLIVYGLLVYRMQIAGSWPLLVLAAALGALVFVTIGLLLTGLARSSEAVIALGQVVQFPMMFLSGVLFPLEMLPEFLRPVAGAIPLTYLNDALQQTMLGAPPMYPLWLDFAVLAGVLAVVAGLAAWRFRWE